MLGKKLLLSLILIVWFSFLNGQKIAVDILGHLPKSDFKILITRGNYETTFFKVKKGDTLLVKNGVLTYKNASHSFKGKPILLSGTNYVNHFKILSNQSSFHFDDDIELKFHNNATQIINHVDLDHYVAGVVEGEAGYNLPLEYYKLQAILCRTYALKNINRHQQEGYNLCDKVHCQVYHKKCTKNEIVKATAATSGLIVIDNDLNLINTTFHSNCGGQTCNSEDVWISKVDYLRSVKDTFCTTQPHAYWKKTIPKEDFESILLKNHQTDSLEVEAALFLCQDTARFPHKQLISTKLTELRSRLQLRSTFFSIEPDSNILVLHGKGFGHGVGLCQEGGIEMARRGYSYVDILKYYYQSVYIVNQRALLFFKEQ